MTRDPNKWKPVIGYGLRANKSLSAELMQSDRKAL